MQAIVQDEYGSPATFELRDVPTPEPGAKGVLVRVHAAAVHAGDWYLMAGTPYVMRLAFGLRKPRNGIPGWDLAGTVEAVGKDVTRFQPGDEVFGSARAACAEYTVVKEKALAPKPANLGFVQAAGLAISGLTALQALRDKAKVKPGQKVLVNGASGGVGTYAVQIAKALGAEVTGVCSARNLDLVRSLGADHVIDYTTEDVTTGDTRYDVILDNVGNAPVARMRQVLSPTGILIPNAGGRGGRVLGAAASSVKELVGSLFVRQKIRPFVSTVKTADLLALKELVEAGKVTPVVDRTFPLAETGAALVHVGEGHPRGKVIVTI